jgi:hypothetical protein
MVQKQIKKEKRTINKPNRYIVIDYPKENEVITYPWYTIRIGCSENKNVEVSIDNGPWEKCRFAEGYWWFDWGNYQSGQHKIVARVRHDKGMILKKSEIRTCECRL